MIFSLGFFDSKNGSLGPFRGLGLRPRPQKEPRQPFFIISKPSGKKSNYTWKNFLHPSIEQSVKESTIFSGFSIQKIAASDHSEVSAYGLNLKKSLGSHFRNLKTLEKKQIILGQFFFTPREDNALRKVP